MDSRAERIERMARELLNTTWVREREKSPGSGAAEALRAALAQPAVEGDEYRRGVEDAARLADEWAGQNWHTPLSSRIRALAPAPEKERTP